MRQINGDQNQGQALATLNARRHASAAFQRGLRELEILAMEREACCAIVLEERARWKRAEETGQTENLLELLEREEAALDAVLEVDGRVAAVKLRLKQTAKLSKMYDEELEALATTGGSTVAAHALRDERDGKDMKLPELAELSEAFMNLGKVR